MPTAAGAETDTPRTKADRLLPALGQRERATLGAMAACGRIGSAELIAANRWAREYAAAEYGVFEDDGNAKPTAGPRLFAQEARTAAATRYREARAATGAAGDARLRLLLSEGLSLAAIAKRLNRNPSVASGLIEGDLARLSEHYTNNGNSRRAKPLH